MVVSVSLRVRVNVRNIYNTETRQSAHLKNVEQDYYYLIDCSNAQRVASQPSFQKSLKKKKSSNSNTLREKLPPPLASNYAFFDELKNKAMKNTMLRVSS
jgi:hypothetical protein